MQQEIQHTVTSADDRKLTPKELRKVRRQGVKARMRRKRILCFVLVVAIIAVCAMPFYRHVFQPWQAKTLYQTTKNLYGQTGSGKLDKAYNEYFGALYDMNPEVGGWLIVSGENPDGVDLHLPVVQPQKNPASYYENHLFNGKTNPYGTPYFMNGCQTDTPAYNTVIRGGLRLMGELGGYRNLDFYKNAPTLFLDTLTETAFYKIFAVVDLPDTEVTRLAGGAFESENAFHAFVTEMGNRSVLYTGISVDKTDSLLTLLCDTGAENIAVVARKVRPDESLTVDTSMAYARQMGDLQTVTDWVASPSDLQVSVGLQTATDVTTPTDAATPADVETDELV